MFDLLELEPFLPSNPSPEYKKQLAVVDPSLQTIPDLTSRAFFDGFWEENAKLSSIEPEESFLHGLRMRAAHPCSCATASQNASPLTAGSQRFRSPPFPSSK